jgi:hypothetical protein
MEIQFFKEVELGNIRIEISIVENAGFKVFLTAKDANHNRLWRTTLTDVDGHVTIFRSISDAVKGAEQVIEYSTGKHSTISV